MQRIGLLKPQIIKIKVSPSAAGGIHQADLGGSPHELRNIPTHPLQGLRTLTVQTSLMVLNILSSLVFIETPASSKRRKKICPHGFFSVPAVPLFGNRF
jgi:hypothetical protein